MMIFSFRFSFYADWQQTRINKKQMRKYMYESRKEWIKSNPTIAKLNVAFKWIK